MPPPPRCVQKMLAQGSLKRGEGLQGQCTNPLIREERLSLHLSTEEGREGGSECQICWIGFEKLVGFPLEALDFHGVEEFLADSEKNKGGVIVEHKRQRTKL